MDRLQRLFGGKGEGATQEQQQTQEKPVLVDNNPMVYGMPIFPEFMVKPTPTGAPSAAVKSSESSQPPPEPKLLVDIPKDASVTETGIGQMMNRGREIVLKVVPLTEGDCLSCKLIGSGVMWAGAGVVLFNFPRARARYTGVKRTLCTIQALSLTSVLVLLGAARFFDLSLFAPADETGKKKGLGELLQEDLVSLQKLTSMFSSSSKSSENKPDS